MLLPFVTALLWGTVLSVSSWPLYRRLVKLLGGRRTFAAFLMALAMICVILLPFVIIGATLGVIVGVVLALIISAVGIPMPPGPNSEAGLTAAIRLVPSVIVTAFVLGVAGAVVASLLPARKVARIPVVEALRQAI